MAIEFLILLIVVGGGIWLLRKGLGSVNKAASGAGSGSVRPRPDLSVSELRSTLRAGGLPAPVKVSFPLRPGEVCVGIAEADLEQWLEGDGTYTHKSVGWAGGLTGLAVGGAINAVGNARRRSAAAREAAERWRSVGRFRVYVTTNRIALEGSSREWHEVAVDSIRRVEIEDGAVVIQPAGETATRMRIAPTEYWYLLLRKVALDEAPDGSASA